MKNGLRIGLPVLILVAVATLRAADVVSIWGGARHVIILKTDGTVWAWGDNSYGKLGIGQTNTLYQTTPVEVHDAANVSFLNSVKLIMGGEEHNVAVKTDGTVWSWGWNAYGQLGNGTTNDSWVPTQTGLTANPPLTNVIKLGGRPYFTLAVKSDGTIWAWGMNQYGQMGNGTVNSPVSSPQVTVPVMVSNSAPGDPINNPLQVTCGYAFGAALATNGTVWTWGTSRAGELGNGASGPGYNPAQVPGLTNITYISAGWGHMLALKSDGTVWAWGGNASGEVGDGTSSNRYSPVQVLNVSNIVAVSGGDSHSSALAADGTVWKWGLNDLGELGNGTTNAIPNPYPAEILLDSFGNGFSNVVLLSARDYHNIALKSDGSVWTWGWNNEGQCGNGTVSNTWRPSPVVGLGARVQIPLSLSAGSQSGFANLSWPSAAGEYFSVECSTNLANGFTGWQSNVLATPPTNQISVPTGYGQVFYRLKF